MKGQEVIKKFGDLELRFSGYYKYMFSFKGERDGYDLLAGIGGGSSEIYRLSIKASETRIVNPLSEWTYLIIKDASGNEVFSVWND